LVLLLSALGCALYQTHLVTERPAPDATWIEVTSNADAGAGE
jgi:hypothetical protein